MSSPCRARHPEPLQHAKPQPGPPPSSSDETLLAKAIESASHTQLCQILRQLCSHSKTATKLTAKHLIPPLEKTEVPKKPMPRSILKKPGSFKRSSQPSQSSLASSASPTSTPLPSSQIGSQAHSASVKRKALTQCRNCGIGYFGVSSSVEACVHHPGKREVDSEHEVWIDFDPDVLGDAWTLMEYEEFASGFLWSCCKREVGEKGCVVGRHEAAPVGEWKRARR